MKQDRRQFVRQPVEADVRLYHSSLGCFPARMQEWSPAGIRLCGTLPCHNGHDFRDSYFQLGADCLDVIFTMQFVRLVGDGLVLRFVDERDAPGR